MRQIKFRAWDNQKKKMILDNFSIDWRGYPHDTVGHLGRNQSEDDLLNVGIYLMQFTGLLDKNGKEIYEGDIVRDISNSDLVFEVKWDEEKLGYYMPTDYDEEYVYSLNTPELEIIGNIYENPELLTLTDK